MFGTPIRNRASNRSCPDDLPLAGFGASSQLLELPARMLGFVLSFGVNTVLFLLAFKVLTDVPLQWRQLLPGAVVGGSAWVILQAAGGYYVNSQLQRANQTYGVFAVAIGLLSWLYLQAQIILIAAELNVVRVRRLWPRRLTEATPLSQADQRTLHHLAKVEERISEEDINVRLATPDLRHGASENRDRLVIRGTKPQRSKRSRP